MDLKALRAMLVEHYRRLDDVRRMATDAGLPVARIRFVGATVENAWWGVLDEARRRPAAFRALITAAAEDYPDAFLSVLDIVDDLLDAREDKPTLAPPRRPSIGSLERDIEVALTNKERLQAAGADENAVRAANDRVLLLKRAKRADDRLTTGYPLGNRYLLDKQLGRGGFAEVWSAWDEMESTYVAVKVLHGFLSDDLTRRERFFRGAHRMAQLEHPHIVKVFEPECEDDGFHYIVMELMRGDLQTAQKKRTILSGEALELLVDIASALEFTHASGVIHRDVKPSNILLDKQGRAKLSDFDLVRASDTTGGTQGGLGTFVYAAPEVGAPLNISGELDQNIVRAATKVGPGADVYSLGMTAACLVHGHPLDRWVVYGRRQFIDSLECSDNMRSVIERAIAIDVNDRFSSALEFGRALQLALDESFSDWHLSMDPSTGEVEMTPGPLPIPRKPAIGGQSFRPAMSLISPGGFFMGSVETEKGRTPRELRHEVHITRPFLMATTPVTQAQYRTLMGSNPSMTVGDDLPVERVSWVDSVRFCNALSTQEHRTPAYDLQDGGRQVSMVPAANGYRLPTEAQWEYACRAGSDRRWWSGGRPEDLKRVGWFSGNADAIQPVAQLAANGWGLYDMHGNVWEWCEDTFGEYAPGPIDDPTHTGGGKRRVLRGGAHNTTIDWTRSAARYEASYDSVNNEYGFRVVLPVEYYPSTVNRPAMTFIRAGQFPMGETTKARTVDLTDPYLLATTPITQAQYRELTGTTPSRFRGADHPVESVTWLDAITYCNALSEAEERAPAYQIDGARVERLPGADGYRLPTEAEWEYACRAGTVTQYWSGHTTVDLERVAWVSSNSNGKTHAVAQKPHNPWGLHDMHGNVCEWCHDWFEMPTELPALNPFGPGRGTHRVQRGGSFSYLPKKSTAAHRRSLVPTASYDDLGFRVMRPLGDSAILAARIRAESASTRPVQFVPQPAIDATEIHAALVMIPQGALMMGSPEEEAGRGDDEAQHAVALSRPYLMATTPVTQAQYRAVMQVAPSDESEDGRPVDSVSWTDAVRYCITLSLKMKLEVAYVFDDHHRLAMVPGANGFRLPTEAEWEHACRAGTMTPYHTGEDPGGLEHSAWLEGPDDAACMPVAHKRPNAWGLYDLHGNIDEWCHDYYGPYPPGPVDDPTGPETGSLRVVRGGHWAAEAAALRSARRRPLTPSDCRPTVGFRVVRNAPRVEAKPTRPALNYIPAGRFLMGSPTSEPGHKRDESLRTVILTRPVFMAETPVTQAQYEAVVGRNPSRAPGKDRPVERVKWLEAALDYCNALSKLEGLTPAYLRRGNQVRLVEGAMGYRLPTEAEWEYACRAGQSGPYPGGDDSSLDATAWYVANSKRRSHPVGEKAPNGWGLFDMRGNVWEWCSDLYERLLVGPATDPTGAAPTQRREGGELETRRVRRGASFDNRPLFLRAAHRMRSEPHEVFNNVGFRVVRPIAD